MLRWLALFLLFSGLSLDAQILINEYSCSNFNTIADTYGEYEDWIELYNAGTLVVNLDGYSLSNDPAEPDKWQFPSHVLPPGGYVLIICSGRNLNGVQFHTNFKLNQLSGETIVFSDPGMVVLDQKLIVPTQTDHSRGRLTNGAPDWGLFTAPSPLSFNISAQQEYTPKPEFNLAPGFYPGNISLEISSPDPTATIRFTLDGSVPVASSLVYSNPILIDQSTVIRAKNFSSEPDVPASFIESNTYIINTQHTGMLLSLSTDEFSLLENGTPGQTTVIGAVELFDKSGTPLFDFEGDIFGYDGGSWAFPQKSLLLKTRDEYGYANTVPEKLFRYNSRNDFPELILRNAGEVNYPSSTLAQAAHLRDGFAHSLAEKYDFKVDVSSYQPCVLYLNGAFYGMYDLREPFDSTFIEYHYGQTIDSIDVVEYNNGINVPYGDATDWTDLLDFIQNNDMNISANFQYVEERLDLESLSDYYILNNWLVNTNWLQANTRVWRGNASADKRWRYSMGNSDHIFDVGANPIGLDSTGSDTAPCAFSSAGTSDNNYLTQINILDKLLENDNFFQQFFDHFLNLQAVKLSCDSAQSVLDTILSELGPDMPKHMALWGGDFAEWLGRINFLRDEIVGRCGYMPQGLDDCYGVEELLQLIVDVTPAASGNVSYQGIAPVSYPDSSYYLNGTAIQFIATPLPNYEFVEWTVSGSDPPVDNSIATIDLIISGATYVRARFKSLLCNLELTETIDQGCGPNEGTISIVMNGGSEPYNYEWNIPVNTPQLENLYTGIYTLSISDALGCSMSQSFAIQNPVFLDILVNSTEAGCDLADGTANAQVSGGTPPYDYQWDTAIPQTGEQAIGMAAGQYSVFINDSLGCTDDQSFVVFEAGPPSGLLWEEVNGEVRLEASGGLAPYTYNWAGSGNNYEGETATPYPGAYNILVTDARNCTYEESIYIEEPELPCLLNMLTITPNGDGKNDRWVLPCLAVYGSEVEVFNRHGQKVFNAFDYDNSWEGNYKGKPLPDGAYFYVVKVEMPYGDFRVVKGALNIVR